MDIQKGLRRGLAALALPMLVVTGLLGSWAPAAAEEAAQPTFDLEDVFELEYASDPRMAPDGQSVIYVRVSMDIMTDRRRGSLWMVASDGSRHRPLLADGGSYTMPRWSPDGRRLAYVEAGGGTPQIHVRWMDTGQTARLTQLTSSPANMVWSPDGRQLAFTMRMPADAKPLASMPSPPKGARWADKPTVIDGLIYRRDGAGFVDPGYTHLFVVPAEGGTPRQLTSGEFNVIGAPAWLPNGEGLVFSSNRNEDWEYDPVNSELYSIDLSGETIEALTDRKGPDQAPAVSPNGRFIAFLGYDDELFGYHNVKPYILDRRNGSVRMLQEDLDRSVGGVAWAPDSSGIFIQYDDEGTTKLALVSLRNQRRDLLSGLGGTSIGRPYPGASFTVGPGGAYATVVTDGRRPADVAVARSLRSEATRVTDLNADTLDRFGLSDMTEIKFPSSHDEREIQAWYLTPPNFDPEKQYPLILEIHGGPFANYGPRFSAEGQLFAAAGHVVLFVNPRGSTSYGAEFANLIHHNYPSEDYDDLMSGVDALMEKGFIDPERLFITGGSGGGVLTAWTVGKTDRFRAAVVAKPVINWQSFVLTADAYNFFYKYWFPAKPWEIPDQYWSRSPLSLVGNVKTPTMLLTGEADYRTPMSETEQYYQALKLQRVDAAMVRIPGASHSIARRPSQLIAKVAYILAWFDRYDTDKDATEKAGDAKENGAAEEESL